MGKDILKSDLKRIIIEMYRNLLLKEHLTPFFKTNEQIDFLSQKQLDFFLNLIINDLEDNDKIKDYYKNIANEKHLNLNVNCKDIISAIDFIMDKLDLILNLRDMDSKKFKLNQKKSFLKTETYKTYILKSLKEIIFNWKLFEKEIKEISEIHISNIEKLIKIIENNQDLIIPSHLDCKIGKYLSSLKYKIKSFKVSDISNMVILAHKKIHKEITDLKTYIKGKYWKLAYQIAEDLFKDSQFLLEFLIFIENQWKNDSENIFLEFISNPFYARNLVSIAVLPSQNSRNIREMFYNFSSKIVSLTNSLEKTDIFAFLVSNEQNQISSAYIVFENEDFEKNLDIIIKVYEESEKFLRKKYNIDKDFLSNIYKFMVFSNSHLIDKYKLNFNEIKLFIHNVKNFKKGDVFYIFKDKDYSEIIDKTKEESKLINKLERLENLDFISLYGQSIVNIYNKKVFSYEILSRIVLENGEIYPAYKFINLVKNLNLTDEFDIAVLKNLIKFVKQNSFNKNFKFFVNLFPSSYFNKDISFLIGELKKIAVDKHIDIVFEITEQENYKVEEILEILDFLDVEMAIDDLGSGYSNFAKLAEISSSPKLKYFKIDGELVKHIEKKEYSKLLEAFSETAKSLDKYVIFEWVENENIENAIKRITKDKISTLGQGFYYSIPEPLENIIK